MMQVFQAIVDLDFDGCRLDAFMAESMQRAGVVLSKRKIKAIIDAGGVSLNKKRQRIASYIVRRGDQVRWEYSEVALKDGKKADFSLIASDILYDQHGVTAINKPPGLPSQQTRDPSVMHAAVCLQAYFIQSAQRQRDFILVHRLDKETSGVLLLSDDKVVATQLTDQFRHREVKKTYWALVAGIPLHSEFSEHAHLSEIDKKTGDVRAVTSGGRSAVTRFKVLASHARYGVSLIECYPETGRSHQIRVHLAINGLPILGDRRYGRGTARLPAELKELCAVHHLLHAYRLSVKVQSGDALVSLEAPLPPRFRAMLKALNMPVS